MSPERLSDAELLGQAGMRSLPISDAGLLRQALTHKSLVPDEPLQSNERLEFLGDAILNDCIAEHLFHAFPQRSEGDLAKSRSLVVCKAALASSARRMCLEDLVMVGATEEALGGRARDSLLADTLEALIAVVAITNGRDVAAEWILKVLGPEIEHVSSTADWRDPKTILQEHLQSLKLPLPEYTIIAQQGKPHDQQFTAQVTLDGEWSGQGTGKTKKSAEQAAAQSALIALSFRDGQGKKARQSASKIAKN